MNIVSIGIAAASVVAGLAGAGVAYELATVDSPDSSASASASPGKQTGEQTGKDRIRWKPCEAPAVREGRACVTEQVRLVPIGGSTPAGSAALVRRSDDDLAHDAFDDHGGDRDDDFDDDRDDDFDDDDHADDHGGDDDGDDDSDDSRDDDSDDSQDDDEPDDD